MFQACAQYIFLGTVVECIQSQLYFFNFRFERGPVVAHTFEELKKKTVAELREIAAGVDHEAVKGYSQLNKEHLLAAMCKALGIDMHAHKKVVAGNKADIK